MSTQHWNEVTRVIYWIDEAMEGKWRRKKRYNFGASLSIHPKVQMRTDDVEAIMVESFWCK